MRYQFAFLFFMAAMPFTVNSQEKPEQITEKFFVLLVDQGPDAAVDYVFSTNKWLVSENNSVEAVKQQLKKGISMLGEYYGHELHTRKSLGENYVILCYLLRYERQPLGVNFILYRPDTKWQIQSMKFDERLDDDLNARDD